MLDNNVFKILQELGLTEYESKTLVSLFKFKETDAPTLSRNSEIPKTRIYDVLEKLKKKGFVLEVYGRPKRFRSINPSEIFKSLIEIKNKELESINKKVDDILSKVNWKSSLVSNKEKVLQVKNISDYNKLLSQELEGTRREVLGFTNLDDRYDSFKNLKSKDVSIKIITNPLTKNLTFPKNMDVQEQDHSMDAFVLDGKKVIMALNDLSVPKKSYNFTVQENNPSLAHALLSHFNSFWKK